LMVLKPKNASANLAFEPIVTCQFDILEKCFRIFLLRGKIRAIMETI
jgi:hypothetical protein